MRAILPFAAALATSGFAHASPADVIDAKAERRGQTWTVSATIRHADTGWDHYADRFAVIAQDGTVLATRVLAHPHVDEQLFTRSLSGIAVPAGIQSLTVRAGDNLGDETGTAFRIDLR